ncbi:hypothetical protein B5E62_12685 [Lachnoclostridium sp. An118]|nr:hypothetical protein B5E62_12685 [Lachnoclostridium sp. An118]
MKKKHLHISRNTNIIKILFIYHGSILKNSGKACKINSFTARKGAYYTTTTPFLKEPRCDIL